MKHLGVLHVNMFQNCVVTRRAEGQTWVISDQDNDSKKVWVLLAYLLWNHGKPVPREALIDLLWSDEEISDPANSLKALLFRVRNLLGQGGLGFEDAKSILRYQGGGYLWHPDLRIELDVEQFESRCAAAEAARHAPDTALEHMRAAIALYTGNFLSQSVESGWATPLSVYFHAKFLKICASAIELLEHMARHEEIIALCRSAILIYDELLHGAMIRALAASGAVHTAMQHYQYITEVFMRQFGAGPSDEMVALYRSLHKSTAEHNLQAVRNELEEADVERGPYFCGYATFKEIYHLSARSAARTGEVVQLVMLTLQTRGELRPKQLHAPMKLLYRVIASTLRLGDVVTQYSRSQYLILLPAASYENAEKVAARLLDRFSQVHKSPHSVRYSLMPMLPAMRPDLFLADAVRVKTCSDEVR